MPEQEAIDGYDYNRSYLEVCREVGSTTRKHDAHRPGAFFGAPCCSSNAALSSSNSMPCIAKTVRAGTFAPPCQSHKWATSGWELLNHS